MLGEVMRILAVADGQAHDHYPTTLFAQAEAQAGRCYAEFRIMRSRHKMGSANRLFSPAFCD
jgi:hypothetical protein